MKPQTLPRPCPVMLLCRELGPGGSERQLTQLALHLDPRRFQVHVGSFRPDGMRAADLRAAGIPIVRVPVHSYKRPTTLAAAVTFCRYIRRFNIRIVHTFDVPVAFFAVPTARLCRVPVVLSSQRAHRNLTPGWPARLLKIVDRLVDGIVVNSQAMRAHMLEERVSPDRLFLVYNGIDISRFSVRAPQSAGPDTCTIGTVCVLRPEKDVVTLVRAFASAHVASPHLRLTIVGDGPERGTIQQLVVTLGLADRVAFAGGTPDVVPWLHRMDMFVLPSLSEAFSNALMEAMACGCCCVASRVGGNMELIEDGVSGRLFQPGRERELGGILADLAAKPDVRRRLGMEASRRISANFTMVRAAETLARHYEMALERKGFRLESRNN